jgi:hypothetical protein
VDKWNEVFGAFNMSRFEIDKIKQSNILRVKILNGPVHTPTLWESFTRKYHSGLYKPDLVAVVDMINVPILENKRIHIHPVMKHFEPFFAQINHNNSSRYNWTSEEGDRFEAPSPFKGTLRILQVGDHKILPDYHKFGKLV